MVEEATVLVVRDDQDRTSPALRITGERFIDLKEQGLARGDRERRVIVIRQRATDARSIPIRWFDQDHTGKITGLLVADIGRQSVDRPEPVGEDVESP